MITTLSKRKEEIINCEKNLLDAFQRCDLSLIDHFLHSNAQFIYPNGLLLTKPTVLENYRSGNSAFHSIETSEQVIEIIDDTATVSMIMELKGTYKDQQINNKFRYIRVWKLMQDEWKVIATSGVQL
ncbi:MAG TPA: nuclear transport factor 2 family protein [Bacteroidia bacterium]|jgi:ketosteroid isomerase-like protein|nr:nuclear transport factor 2 family protein [Bacteroidia bacterium]